MAEGLAKAKTTNNLRGLSPLLVAWLETLEQFCAASGYTNNPWWYNERASISTLAGAAWKLHDKGWVALEEYSTRKRGVVPDKKIEAPKKLSQDVVISTSLTEVLTLHSKPSRRGNR